jgi:hypothetical protein
LGFLLIVEYWLLSKYETEDGLEYLMVALVAEIGTRKKLEDEKG